MLYFISIISNLIIARYYQNSNCLLIFVDNDDFNYAGNLPAVNIRLRNQTFDESLVFHRYFGCQGIIVNVENPVSTMRYLEERIRFNMDRFNFRRYLILPASNMTEDVMDIFDASEIEYIADLLIVHTAEYESVVTDSFFGDYNVVYHFYTHRFVGLNNTNERVFLDEWHSQNASFVHGHDLYPEKLSNAQGRVYKIATFSYKPYSVPATHEGTELELAIAYAQKHNLTPYYVVDEEGEWGEIYDNWTGYGILGNVLNDNGDVGLAALYTWAHEYSFLDLSKPVVRTGITCLTPAPRLAGGWLVPLFSFTYDMWIAVGLSFIICSTSLFALEFYKETSEYYKKAVNNKNTRKKKKVLLQDAIIHTAAIFLLQSLGNDEAKDSIKKHVYACMFVFSLLVASSYSSGLASSLTVPRYIGAIKTVQDLVDSGIQWGATSIAWIMSIMDAKEYNYMVLVERFVKTDGPRLRQYNNKRFAFSIERLPAGHFAIGDYITEEGVSALRLMQEDIYWEQCVLMTRKSSVWLPSLDDFILRIQQTGIARTWEFRVATTHLNAKIQRAVRYSSHHQDSSGPVPLNWTNVQGTFGILSIGIIISITWFVVELIINGREKKLKKRISAVHLN